MEGFNFWCDHVFVFLFSFYNTRGGVLFFCMFRLGMGRFRGFGGFGILVGCSGFLSLLFLLCVLLGIGSFFR